MAVKVSLILPSFRRAELLDRTLSSVELQKTGLDLEIIVVNDGVEDSTREVCEKHNVRYIFSGQRNKDGDIRRVAGFALNIGVKQSTGDILILSCAEMLQFHDCLSQIVTPLLTNKKLLTSPSVIYFDDDGEHFLSPRADDKYAIQMPFLMGMWKGEYMSIGGYDEDFTGYAADDNDFISRLLANGCSYCYTGARAVHMYHGVSCDALVHPENPAWAYNYKLFQDRKGIIVRNQNREWGVIC